MNVTIINDCHDDNVRGRQQARVAALLGCSTNFLGVDSYGDLSAAGHIIDVLDAVGNVESAMLVNVAPRHGKAKKWQNGSPFCHFKVGKTTIVSTFDGATLSLLKKLELVESVLLMDTLAVTKKFHMDGVVSEDEIDGIANSQFRSFDFTPRVLKYLLDGHETPATVVRMSDVPDAPHAVWWIDNFGNVKTTLLPEDVGFEPGKRVTLSCGDFLCYKQLRDVPDNEAGLIIGSSGFGRQRFLEVVVQGQRADENMNLTVGDEILEAEVSIVSMRDENGKEVAAE